MLRVDFCQQEEVKPFSYQSISYTHNAEPSIALAYVLFCSWTFTKAWVRPTDLEQRNTGLASAVVVQPACPLSSQSETSGPSVSARWSAGRGLEQSVSGIVIRSESLGNLEKRRREVPAGRAPERDDARRGERARRRRLRRKVRDADMRCRLYLHKTYLQTHRLQRQLRFVDQVIHMNREDLKSFYFVTIQNKIINKLQWSLSIPRGRFTSYSA